MVVGLLYNPIERENRMFNTQFKIKMKDGSYVIFWFSPGEQMIKVLQEYNIPFVIKRKGDKCFHGYRK